MLRALALSLAVALLVPVAAHAAPTSWKIEPNHSSAHFKIKHLAISSVRGSFSPVTGTVIIDDQLTSRRLAALTPWVHVAVLQRQEIHRTIPDALAALGTNSNTIWCTGPSKTADVEGILIEGVHGPGEQIVLLV